MRVTPERVTEALAQRLGYAPSREQIAMAFLDVDQDKVAADQEKRVRWAVWDRTTPINGVPASKVIDRDYIGSREVYLIYVDDELVMLQPHAPGSEQPLSKKQAALAAAAHAATLVDDMTVGAAIDAIYDVLPPPALSVPVDDGFSASGNGQRRVARGRR